MKQSKPGRRKPWRPTSSPAHPNGHIDCARPDRQLAELEALTSDGAHARRRLRAPFTMPTEVAARASSRILAETEGSHPEPPIRPTRLDCAVNEHERTALARYIEDRSIALQALQSGGYGNSAGGAPGWDRTPMSEDLRRAHERLAWIDARVIPEERTNLNKFAAMMLPTELQPLTTEEFGRANCGSPESKVCKGAFVGAMVGLAQRLHHLYHAQQMTRFRAAKFG